MSDPVSFEVRAFLAGRARTKGSLDPKIVRVRGGTLKVVARDTEHSVAWKKSMVTQLRYLLGITTALRWTVDAKGKRVRERYRSDAEPYAGPVEVHRFFRFEREANADTGEVWPSHETPWPIGEGSTQLGDVDKLTRNLLDALTQAGVLADDRYVIGGAELKRWTRDGEQPGVEILIRPAGVWATFIESIMLSTDQARNEALFGGMLDE